MSAGPRIVFVRFHTVDSPKLSPWIAHSDRVISAHQPTTKTEPSTGLVVWQLVSANNRELARSRDVLDTFEGAQANARSAAAATGRLAIEPVSEAGRGVYGWYGSLDGRPIITCARWYGTDRDRRNSIDLAMRALLEAEFLEGTRLTDAALMNGDRGRV